MSRHDQELGAAGRILAALSARRVVSVLLGCYTVFLAWVLFWPSGQPAAASVDRVIGVLYDAGFSEQSVAQMRVEAVLNTVLIVPVPFLVTLLGARWPWERWAAYAFITAIGVELFQGLALSGRSAEFQDVTANTLGALLGALVGGWAGGRRDRRE